MRTVDLKKYIFVFAITALIFGTALYVSNLATDKRLEEIKTMEDKISVDILSSETQFNLLAQSSCSDVDNPSVSEEINSLAERLSFAEDKLGSGNTQVIDLKRYYSLLEIKDYLLLKQISEKCKTKPLIILYFYSNAGDCNECQKMGYVLTYLRNEYPELRVYSFDYNLDLSALKTFTSILKLQNHLPVIVVDNAQIYGYRSIEDFDTILPGLKALRIEKENASSSAATSTKKE